MIIFLYGPDGYRLKENIDTITSSYRKKYKSGLNLHCFDFSYNQNFDELDNAIKSLSFFNEIKLIIIRNIFNSKSCSDHVKTLIKDLGLDKDKSIVLVFVENREEKELKKINEPIFAILGSKNNLIKNIEHFTEAKLSNWVRNKFKENNCNIPPKVADFLINKIGNESWALANEIEKLSNYYTSRSKASGDGSLASGMGSITEKDVELLISYKEVNNIFDLVDAVGNQNKSRAFEMMYRLINSGHDSHYLLSMLVYHFENLLSVSDLLSRSQASGSGVLAVSVIAQKCGLHPFVAQKAVSQARKFQKNELLEKFNHLTGLDIASKNGQVNLEDSLYNFLFL